MSRTPTLTTISIVLVKTSHPGNVGSVARAMKTMGLRDLRLVCPKTFDIASHPDAISLASGAQDVLSEAQVYQSLPDALHDRSRAYALSARIRELGPVLMSPEHAAMDVFEPRSVSSGGVAFVFGAERSGLSNEDLLICDRQVFIPSNPEYSSLNLSQAVQIIAYALRLQSMKAQYGENQLAILNTDKSGVSLEPLADKKSVNDLQIHWLQAMESVDYLNPDKSRKLIQRLSRLLARREFEQVEVDMLRGFLADVIRVAQGRLYPHEMKTSIVQEKK